MDLEFTSKIAGGDIPADLKSALARYFQVYEPLRASLPETHRGRFDYWLSQLLEQAFDPGLEPHWWEVALFLIAMELEALGNPSRR